MAIAIALVVVVVGLVLVVLVVTVIAVAIAIIGIVATALLRVRHAGSQLQKITVASQELVLDNGLRYQVLTSEQ